MIEEFTEPPIPTTTLGQIVSSSVSVQATQSVQSTNQTTSSVVNSIQNILQSNTIAGNPFNATGNKPASRKGGVIFPSVKNKPSLGNSTFTTDILGYKDVKVTFPYNSVFFSTFSSSMSFCVRIVESTYCKDTSFAQTLLITRMKIFYHFGNHALHT